MKKEKIKKEEYITATGLIQKRDWTKTIVNKLLADVEVKWVDNPHYKCAPPMGLYNMKDIKRIEKTKKFKDAKEIADKRKASAKKAVETQKKNTISMVDKFSIIVERLALEDLKEITLKDKQNWYYMNPKYIRYDVRDYADYDEDDIYYFENSYYEYEYIERNAYTAPDDVVNRWMVNYIRHKLTNYDEELKRICGRLAREEAYTKYKNILAVEMKKVYPELEREIDKYMLGISNDEEILKEDI